MIVVRCPTCGAKLAASLAKPDGTVDCPKCGEPVAGPEAETVDHARKPSDPGLTRSLGGSGSGAAPRRVAVPGYEVLEEVGRGGMGVVYKARQLNPPRTVALKMILAGEHADPDQLARFRGEAEAIARLTHPAIVQIHQVGEWHPPSGGPAVPFLTLEFVAGQSLVRRLAAGPTVTFRQAADLIRRLAKGVHYAHQQGVVHRDLKPGNVLLTGEETAASLGDPKVVDFGLAKPLDGFATAADGPKTRTGAVMGTPSYMAPEQAAGKKKVGPAADVYGLGAILYELLTGRPPFQGESTLETLLQVTNDDPEPPRRIRPKIPRDLETVCLACLAKEPDARYPTAAAVGKDLGRFLDGEPVTVRPPSRLRRLKRTAGRRKELLYLAAGAAAVAVVVGIVLAARPRKDPEPPPDTAQKPPAPPRPGTADEPLPPDDTPVSDARRRMISQNNLKQLAIGLHNLHDDTGELPPPAITDAAGKPLLSWRVALLPYLEQEALFRQFRLTEPWDSPHNKQLVPLMPATFAVEGKSAGPAGTTHYQAAVGPETVWPVRSQIGGKFGRRGLRFADIADGTANTIALVEAATPVVWTKPDDATVEDGKPLPRFGGVVKNGFNVAFADGGVRFIGPNVDVGNLRKAFTRAGGETLPPDWENPPAGRNPPAKGVQRVTEGNLIGKVTYNGKPLAGARVALVAQEAGRGVSAFTDSEPDGTYRFPKFPSGRYRVAVRPADPPPPGFPRLPPRYADPAASGLVVEIGPGDQTFDIALTDR